jgi:hypothetical protein
MPATRRPARLGVAARLLILTVLSTLMWLPYVVSEQDGSTSGTEVTPSQLQEPSERTADVDACSSLTGPFCAHTNSMTFFSAYMTPISVSDLQQEGNEVSRSSVKGNEGAATWQGKKCFFQHFTGSWMDNGGDANDLINYHVASVDECERLCCEHAECQSFTFWRGRTCFLRAKSNTPRQDGDSFSGIRLM